MSDLDAILGSFLRESSVPLSVDAQAAVLIAITEPGAELIMIKRAAHLRHHAGEMAFPGGRVESADADLVQTALREAWEETALPPDAVRILGVMPANSSRFGVPVQPVVGIVPADLSLVPNPDELDAIHRIPFGFFCETTPSLIHEVKYAGERWLMPGFQWGDEVVWGLSARFISRLVEKVSGQKILWPDPRRLE
jgi:8-oxo-dGTP pyrophosphatase MutT (NUDIX family)